MVAVKTLPLDYELVVYSGTTYRQEFRWLPDGNPAMDFTNWTASMLIGVQSGVLPVLSLATNGQGIVLSTTGQIIITMSPMQTAALSPGVLTYSLDLTDTASTILRFLRGRLSVVTDVGRST